MKVRLILGRSGTKGGGALSINPTILDKVRPVINGNVCHRSVHQAVQHAHQHPVADAVNQLRLHVHRLAEVRVQVGTPEIHRSSRDFLREVLFARHANPVEGGILRGCAGRENINAVQGKTE